MPRPSTVAQGHNAPPLHQFAQTDLESSSNPGGKRSLVRRLGLGMSPSCRFYGRRTTTRAAPGPAALVFLSP